MKRLSLLVVLLVACGSPTGKLDGVCNLDGSCDSPALFCESTYDGHYCHLKPAEEKPPKRCRYESECFCLLCADKCGAAGVKACLWSDTSVWGSKPASCECKP